MLSLVLLAYTQGESELPWSGMSLWRETAQSENSSIPMSPYVRPADNRLEYLCCGCWTEACFPVKYLGGVPMGCCWNGVGIQKVLLGICCSFLDEHSTVSSVGVVMYSSHIQGRGLLCGVSFCFVFQVVWWLVGFFFLLKFVGSFFSMVICKTFGSFFVVSVKALLGQSVLYWGENKSRVPQVQNIIMSWSSSPECEEILASFTTVWHDDKIRIQFWWNASQNPLLLS